MLVLNLNLKSNPPVILSGQFPEDRIDGLIDAIIRGIGPITENNNSVTQAPEGYNIKDIYLEVEPKEDLESANIIFITSFINNFITRGEGRDGTLKM